MGKKIQNSYGLPIPVQGALRKLGQDIRDARRRRRIPAAILSERASISRTTLGKIEKGNSGVSMGNYATILFVLGLLDRLSDLADVRTDEVGLSLEEEHLPQRIRASSANPNRWDFGGTGERDCRGGRRCRKDVEDGSGKGRIEI